MMRDAEQKARVTYRVDQHDRLVSVGDLWESFAEENGAGELRSGAVIGQPLAGYIVGPETRHLYELMMGQVRGRRCMIVVPFRCDSPSLRRFMQLALCPREAGQIKFEAWVEREEEREAVALLEPASSRSDDVIVMCSWCKRVDTGSEWLEVEEAVAALHLFVVAKLPQISHGLCGDCEQLISTVRDAPR